MLSISNPEKPEVLAAERDYLVIYKPPKMHSAPLAKSSGENVLSFCIESFPEIKALDGLREGEGGLLHRLDYETHGLLLVARNQKSLDALLARQREGLFKKEYSAIASETRTALPGFPPANADSALSALKSAFRPYGPGRKAVRPLVANTGMQYVTEVLNESVTDKGFLSLRLRILNGFRHQLRCHLAWIGKPILNDALYGGLSFGKGFLALRACSLSFIDPASGRELVFSIPDLPH